MLQKVDTHAMFHRELKGNVAFGWNHAGKKQGLDPFMQKWQRDES